MISFNLVVLVFCYQKFSDLLWEKIVLVIEKNVWNSRLKAENLQIFEIIRTIYSNSERSEQVLVTECFFNLFLEVSHIKLYQIQIGKNYWDWEAGKVRKYNLLISLKITCISQSHAPITVIPLMGLKCLITSGWGWVWTVFLYQKWLLVAYVILLSSTDKKVFNKLNRPE